MSNMYARKRTVEHVEQNAAFNIVCTIRIQYFQTQRRNKSN